jgi:hypothetical protein
LPIGHAAMLWPKVATQLGEGTIPHMGETVTPNWLTNK